MSTFKQLVVAAIVLVGSLFAEDYPMLQSQSITISNKTLTVIELPFKIEGEVRFGIFKTIELKKSNEDVASVETITLNESMPGVKDDIKAAMARNAKNPSPAVKKGINTLEIMPKVEGTFDMTIWGFNKYPVVISINIVKEDTSGTNRYFTFKDYSKEMERALKDLPHEDAIAKMIKPLYASVRNQKDICLEGHRLDFQNWRFETANGLEMKVLFECSGKRYAASKWILTNKNARPLLISGEEDYYSLYKSISSYFIGIKRAIYAINYNTDKEVLRKNESIEMFVVSNIIDKKIYEDMSPTKKPANKEIDIEEKSSEAKAAETEDFTSKAQELVNKAQELESKNNKEADSQTAPNSNGDGKVHSGDMFDSKMIDNSQTGS